MLKRNVVFLFFLFPLVCPAQISKKFSNRFADNYVQPASLSSCDSEANEKLMTDAANDVERARRRNIIARRVEADLIGSEQWYLGRVQRDRSLVYTFLDVANIGATAAAGAVGGPAAAKAFALSATAIAGIKSSVVGNFDGGTANSLMAKIQTSFAQNQILFEQNLNLDYQSHDLSTACSDAVALYDSGQKISTGSKIPARAVVGPGSTAPAARATAGSGSGDLSGTSAPAR